jgi:NAD(P)-dependent dehydrogenase (short-subunit alcohol dehydrogenase family)
MQGKVVVITGASRGIGAAAAGVFADAGARVVLLARSADQIGALAGQVGGTAVPCDVGDWGSVQAAVAGVVAQHGRLDVLINNAGVIEPIARLSEADPADWGRAVDINLKGVFHGCRAAVPVMRQQGAGTIINLSSGAATSPLEGWSAYCASKAGVLMLTRALHLEEGGWGLRVLGLSPGTVATDMQIKIKASGINPVSALDPAVHIPADWPARALLWMCGAGAEAWLGEDVRLRDEAVRRAAGLVA